MTLSTFLILAGTAAAFGGAALLVLALTRAARPDGDTDATLVTQDDFHAAMQRKIARDQRMRP